MRVCTYVLLACLQEVYSTLESLVDKMAMRAGHASLIYETTAKNLGKLLSCMVSNCSFTTFLHSKLRRERPYAHQAVLAVHHPQQNEASSHA